MKTEDDQQYRPVKAPMTDMEFRNYLDSDGHMVKSSEFRLSIYQGGVENSLRRVVWRHLLNIYPESMSGRERFSYMKRKENEYFELRDHWRKLFNEKKVSEDVIHVATLVKKDVLRTDRTHKYYSGGDESKNLIALYNLLVTYALTHPEVSYCQGMSDIASPILVVQKEEAQAYLCFCGLMKRLSSNFKYDGEAITTKLQHLSTLVQFYDPVFFSYMKEHGADDLFFCYRWLLLEMKREFPFDDALYMLEVMWSTLPPDPPEGELALKDQDYCPTLLMSVSPNSPSFANKTQYSRLLAKRRLSTIVKENSVDTARSPQAGVASPKTAVVLLENGLSENLETVVEETQKRDSTGNDADNACSEKSEFEDSGNENDHISQISLEKHNTNEKPEESAYDHVPKINLEDSSVSDVEVPEENLKESDCVEDDSSVTYDTSPEKDSSPDSVKINDTNDKTPDSAKTNGFSSGNSSFCEISSSYHSASVSVKTASSSLCDVGMSTSNSSSYMSSQSMERFPSLISANVDDRSRNGDDETDIVSSMEDNTLTQSSAYFVPSEISSKTCTVQACQSPYVTNSMQGSGELSKEDENDNQALFHLSLDETESEALKRAGNTSVPQIKGSFFSGMKRMLMSPKRRPGRAQPLNGAQNVNGRVNTNGRQNNNGLMQRSMIEYKTNNDEGEAEHTLFEVNRMMRSHSVDSDSGNCSLTSSINSGKTRTSSQTSQSGKPSHPADIKDQLNYFDKKFEEVMSEIPQLSKGSHSSPLFVDKGPHFCENHFSNSSSTRTDETKECEAVSDCMEVVDPEEMSLLRFKQLPSPDQFGYNNPFLMFACLTLLLQHRDVIIKTGMEYDELAMYFDKRVRKHNVNKVLHQARTLYTEYIRMQQKIQMEEKDTPTFSV